MSEEKFKCSIIVRWLNKKIFKQKIMKIGKHIHFGYIYRFIYYNGCKKYNLKFFCDYSRSTKLTGENMLAKLNI